MATFLFDTKKLIEICRQNHVSKVGLFGSMTRGEADIEKVWLTAVEDLPVLRAHVESILSDSAE